MAIAYIIAYTMALHLMQTIFERMHLKFLNIGGLLFDIVELEGLEIEKKIFAISHSKFMNISLQTLKIKKFWFRMIGAAMP